MSTETPWNLRFNWSGRITSPDQSLSVISGETSYIYSVKWSSDTEVDPKLNLKFSLKCFGRTGPVKGIGPHTFTDNEGIALYAEPISTKKYLKEKLMLSVEASVSISDVASAHNYIPHTPRLLTFGSKPGAKENIKCVIRELAVLSQWSGLHPSDNEWASYPRMEYGNTLFLSVLLKVNVINTNIPKSLVRKNPTFSTSQRLIDDLCTLCTFENNLSDIKLQSRDNMIISAHKFVLAARSPYFRRVLQSENLNINQQPLSVSNLDAKPLIAILYWMYSAKLSENAGNLVEEMYKGSKYFELEHLSQDIEAQMVNLCNKENMYHMMQIAKTHSLRNAEKDILEFIKININNEQNGKIKATIKSAIKRWQGGLPNNKFLRFLFVFVDICVILIIVGFFYYIFTNDVMQKL